MSLKKYQYLFNRSTPSQELVQSSSATFAHGSLGGGSLHTVATESLAGFLSSDDKIIINKLSPLSTPTDEKYYRTDVNGDIIIRTKVQFRSDLNVLEVGTGIDQIRDNALLDARFARKDVDETFQANVTVSGNLTVLGTEFIANTQTVEIADNLGVINSGETGSGITAGFAGWRVDRGTADDFVFGYQESNGAFSVGKDGTTLQAIATRQDSPITNGVAYWNNTSNRFDTDSDLTFDGNRLSLGYQAISTTHALRADRTLQFSGDGIVSFDNETARNLTSNRTWNLSIQDASASQSGVVNTGTQSFGGVKTFVDDTYFDSTLHADIIQVSTLRTTLFKPTTISGMGGEVLFSAVSEVVSINTTNNTITVEDAVFSNNDYVVVSSAIYNQTGFSNVKLQIISTGSSVSGGTQYSYSVIGGSEADIGLGDSVTRISGDLVYINATEGSGSPRIAGYENISNFSDSPVDGNTASPVWELRSDGGFIGGWDIEKERLKSPTTGNAFIDLLNNGNTGLRIGVGAQFESTNLQPSEEYNQSILSISNSPIGEGTTGTKYFDWTTRLNTENKPQPNYDKITRINFDVSYELVSSASPSYENRVDVFLVGKPTGSTTWEEIELVDSTFVTFSSQRASRDYTITKVFSGYDTIGVKVIAENNHPTTDVQFFVENTSIIQYRTETLIREDGIYSLVAPNRVVTIGESSGSGGSLVELPEYTGGDGISIADTVISVDDTHFGNLAFLNSLSATDVNALPDTFDDYVSKASGGTFNGYVTADGFESQFGTSVWKFLGNPNYGQEQIILIAKWGTPASNSMGRLMGTPTGANKNSIIIDYVCQNQSSNYDGLSYEVSQQHRTVYTEKILADYNGTTYIGIRIYGSSANYYPDKWFFQGYNENNDLKVVNIGSVTNVTSAISGANNIGLKEVNFDIIDFIGDLQVDGNTVWHEGNDGAGSGLDADMLDGIQAERIPYGDANSYATTRENTSVDTIARSGFYFTGGGTTGTPTTGATNLIHSGYNAGAHYGFQVALEINTSRFFMRGETSTAGSWNPWRELYHTGNLTTSVINALNVDADTLDGNHASAFATGDNFSTTGTYAGLRAQATTAGDVGLGSSDSVEFGSVTAGDGTFTGTSFTQNNRFTKTLANRASSVNQSISEVRIPWSSTSSGWITLEVEVMVETNSVGTRGYVKKKFLVSSYSPYSSGEIYSQVGWIAESTSGNGHFTISDIIEDSANGEIVIEVYCDSDRSYTLEVTAWGNNQIASQILNATLSENVQTGVAYQSLQPTSVQNDFYTPDNLYIGGYIRPISDTNTYMQFHEGDQWRVVTGGSERLEVNNSAVTVQNQLQVNGSITGNAISGTTGSFSGNVSFAGAGGINIAKISPSLFDLESSNNIAYRAYNHRFHTTGGSSGAERMRIDENGNVGIGTTSPDYKLHILDSNYIKVERSGAGYILLGNDSSANALYSRNNDGSARDFRFLSGSSEVMRVRADGNVGIGTTTPDYKLDVVGRGSFRNNTTITYPDIGTTTGASALHIISNSSTNDRSTAITFGSSITTSGTTAQAGIYVQTSGSYGTRMRFATTDSFANGAQSRMMIDSNGVISTPSTGKMVSGDFELGSDRRLKSDIQDLHSIDLLRQLQPKSFYKNEKFGYGFIAQDIQELVPSMVSDSGEYLSLRQTDIIALNTSAIQYLDSETDQLKRRVQELEDQVRQLGGSV